MEERQLELLTPSEAVAIGEGQQIEWMQGFPDNAWDLRKEIAAFATSNPGVIFLGISNAGDLVGIDGLDHPEGKDEMMRRIDGVARGVKPSVTVRTSFPIDEEAKVTIVRIAIPSCPEPVYYVGDVPYLRSGQESRPANPDEVKELHKKYLKEVGESDALDPSTARTLSYIAKRNLIDPENSDFGLTPYSRKLTTSYLEEWNGYGHPRYDSHPPRITVLAAYPDHLRPDFLDTASETFQRWMDPNSRRYEPNTGALFIPLNRPIRNPEGYLWTTDSDGYYIRYLAVHHSGYVEHGSFSGRRLMGPEDLNGENIIYLARNVGIFIMFLNLVQDLCSYVKYGGPMNIILAIRRARRSVLRGLGKGLAYPEEIPEEITEPCEDMNIRIAHRVSQIDDLQSLPLQMTTQLTAYWHCPHPAPCFEGDSFDSEYFTRNYPYL
jgi:hypothetical protein